MESRNNGSMRQLIKNSSKIWFIERLFIRKQGGQRIGKKIMVKLISLPPPHMSQRTSPYHPEIS
jgi:hypothetical protein